MLRQQLRGEILVNDCGGALEMVMVRGDDGNTTAAAGEDHVICLRQRPDGGQFHYG